MIVALFGITNDALNLAVNLLILFLVVLWIALIAWTFLDARRRIKDPVLVACATAASLFPFVGSIVYSILRPPEFLDDRRERELEIRASELRIRQLEEASCPNCEHPVERTYLRCPNCRARIKDRVSPAASRWTRAGRFAPIARPRSASLRPSNVRAARYAAPRPPRRPAARELEPSRSPVAITRERRERTEEAKQAGAGARTSRPRERRRRAPPLEASAQAQRRVAATRRPSNGRLARRVVCRADGGPLRDPDPDQARRLRARAQR